MSRIPGFMRYSGAGCSRQAVVVALKPWPGFVAQARARPRSPGPAASPAPRPTLMRMLPPPGLHEQPRRLVQRSVAPLVIWGCRVPRVGLLPPRVDAPRASTMFAIWRRRSNFSFIKSGRTKSCALSCVSRTRFRRAGERRKRRGRCSNLLTSEAYPLGRNAASSLQAESV